MVLSLEKGRVFNQVLYCFRKIKRENLIWVLFKSFLNGFEQEVMIYQILILFYILLCEDFRRIDLMLLKLESYKEYLLF